MEDIIYAIDLYLDGLSLRKVSKALSRFVKRSHTAISDWIHKYQPKRLLSKTKKIDEYIVDETLIKVGSRKIIWFWIAIEPENRQILALLQKYPRRETCSLLERFLSNLVKDYGNHPVSTDGGIWYPQACEFLQMDHHIHSSLEKSLIERKMQYIKDRTEIFDDYFPCRKQNCKLEHIIQWIKVFAYHHNNNIRA